MTYGTDLRKVVVNNYNKSKISDIVKFTNISRSTVYRWNNLNKTNNLETKKPRLPKLLTTTFRKSVLYVI